VTVAGLLSADGQRPRRRTSQSGHLAGREA
jgi:hypothetical protein